MWIKWDIYIWQWQSWFLSSIHSFQRSDLGVLGISLVLGLVLNDYWEIVILGQYSISGMYGTWPRLINLTSDPLRFEVVLLETEVLDNLNTMNQFHHGDVLEFDLRTEDLDKT